MEIYKKNIFLRIRCLIYQIQETDHTTPENLFQVSIL